MHDVARARDNRDFSQGDPAGPSADRAHRSNVMLASQQQSRNAEIFKLNDGFRQRDVRFGKGPRIVTEEAATICRQMLSGKRSWEYRFERRIRYCVHTLCFDKRGARPCFFCRARIDLQRRRAEDQGSHSVRMTQCVTDCERTPAGASCQDRRLRRRYMIHDGAQIGYRSFMAKVAARSVGPTKPALIITHGSVSIAQNSSSRRPALGRPADFVNQYDRSSALPFLDQVKGWVGINPMFDHRNLLTK